MQVYPIQIN